MPEDVTVLEGQEIIKVHSWGIIKPRDLWKTLQTVMRIHDESGLRKVLVDATGENTFPATGDVFDFGEELAKAHDKGMQFAIVTSPGTALDLQFLETVARNRGGFVQNFMSEEEALIWLKA